MTIRNFLRVLPGIEMTWPSAVVNIMDAENAALTGEGFIDCRGKVFWDKYWEMRKEYEKKKLRWIVDYDCKRVRGILVSNSKHITLKDFALVRTGFGLARFCIPIIVRWMALPLIIMWEDTDRVRTELI